MDNLRINIDEFARQNAHPPVDYGDRATGCTLQDNSDGRGPFIRSWMLGWTQPTPAELTAVESDAITSDNKLTLAEQAENIAIAGQVAVSDPVGRVPAPANDNARTGYLQRRRTSWETEAKNPTVSPSLTSVIRVADGEERAWSEAEGMVARKISAGVYTTESDVTNASEWP